MSIHLAYTRRGAGEPLVLLHGIGHRLEAFDPIVEQLATQFDVIAVDLPGFGQSPGFAKATDYGLEALADAVADNFERWGIEKPHIVGNSLGGAVSVLMGQRNQVRSVTALSPAGWFFPWSLLLAGLPLLLMKIGAFTPEPWLRAFVSTQLGRRIMGLSLYRYPLRHSAEDSLADARAMRNAAGFWPMFIACIPLGFKVPRFFRGPARVPTTIAWGGRDMLLSPQQAGLAARYMSGVQFVSLPDAGHVPMADNPAAVIDAIATTVARADEQTRPAA